MKKLIFILFLLITLSVTVLPQKADPKSVFSADMGVAVAYDQFACNTFNYDAGFATAGPDFKAEFLYYGRFVGFSSGIGYSTIFFNKKDYQSEYDRVLDGYGENEVTAGNYQVLRFLIGFTFKVPEFKHTEIMLLSHLGYAFCVHPTLRVTNTGLGEINSVAGDTGGSIIASAGFKVNYWLTDRYGITLNGSVNSTRPSFSDETSSDGIFFLPIDYYTVNAGLVIRLNTYSR